ncbi:hypothetical protein G6F70_003704 [Rhizopus microsporus]|nr:hypothetical protein G6F71_004657 [Rhizopus microsporus]KAG1200819.1 hypothetical protein G6F70_003704 [Rhizopus microsporus]KAG1211509.1 hypothetical protein G6F69_004530 [Rhizopus microsporus]KAG1234715.1 hypothetical protein G6F67_003304 [Rhizopus microsporus]KAG1262993.1 hypothetical protein G6F68_005505 [Rhizopus microsporus]
MVSALINDTSLYCLIARFTQEEEGEKEEFEGGRGGKLEEEEEKKTLDDFKKNIRKALAYDDEEEATFDFLEAVLKAIYLAKQDLYDGEATFNSLLIYPFLNAVCIFVADSVAETFLKSMIKQLKNSYTISDSCQYKVDGILKVYLDKEIEVALLETSSHFLSTLVMIKNIVYEYCFAITEAFSKLKVLFIHAADDKALLWSIRFVEECSMFEICVLQLKSEHEEALKKCRFRATKPSRTLKSVVKPSILKLTEEEGNMGMADLGPFYSNPTSPKAE